MKAFALYHPESEFARIVEEFAHDYNRTRHQDIELCSLETTEGAHRARLYDIVQYPAICVVKDSGELVKEWQGGKLPLMDEVAAYFT